MIKNCGIYYKITLQNLSYILTKQLEMIQLT